MRDSYTFGAFLLLAFGLLFGGCVSTGGNRAAITDINKSLATINRAIRYGLQGDSLRRRANGRVIYSQFHPPGESLLEDATQQEERAQVVIYILKERRPYTLVVDYRIQERRGDDYKFVRADREEADKIRNKIRKYLASSPDRTDLIDGFRAF